MQNQLPRVTFIEQKAPVDEYGRALYAVVRSILRAYIDSLSAEDLTDINTPLEDVRFRQLAKIIRIERDKGMRGDGFEWAVHEAIVGGELSVTELISQAIRRCSRYVRDAEPRSLLFGQERARYLGFLDAVVDEAGTDAYLLPQGKGTRFNFGPWVSKAAKGIESESELNSRIKKIWMTDLFLSAKDDPRYFAATIKSNFEQLVGGAGLRVGIVPESTSLDNRSGVRWIEKHQLWLVSLADPNGFMGLFNDAYHALAHAIYKVGKQGNFPYFLKPSAKAQLVQDQLEKASDARVLEIEDALNQAAQQNLVSTKERLVSVNAPPWLHIKEMAPKIISPKPSFKKLD